MILISVTAIMPFNILFNILRLTSVESVISTEILFSPFSVPQTSSRSLRTTIKLQSLHNATDNVTNSIIFRIFLSTSAAPTTRDGIFLCGVTHARRENLDYQQHADLVMRLYLTLPTRIPISVRTGLCCCKVIRSSAFYLFLRCAYDRVLCHNHAPSIIERNGIIFVLRYSTNAKFII